jgi:PD-(D/E)XK endonuclease
VENPKKNTHATGDRTEAILMSYLLGSYDTVLIPFGNGRRYDLVLEDADRRFFRVQCKTGWIEQGAICFNTCSASYRNGRSASGARRTRGYAGEVDFFGVYCPATGEAYLVPVDHVGNRLGVLRVEPPRNNQSKNIRWAKDYVLTPPQAVVAQ